MNAFKLSAIATLLAGAALSASAMTSIDDAALSQVSGQDGVSIAGDLHVKGDFSWSNTSAATGHTGSINFKTEVSGIFGVAIDVLNRSDAIASTAAGLAQNYGMTAPQVGTALAALGAATFQTLDATGVLVDSSFGFGTTDVVQFAFPKLNPAALGAAALSIKVTPQVADATGALKSFGTFEAKNLDLSGTKIAIWAH